MFCQYSNQNDPYSCVRFTAQKVEKFKKYFLFGVGYARDSISVIT
jgi:hypothetical protein